MKCIPWRNCRICGENPGRYLVGNKENMIHQVKRKLGYLKKPADYSEANKKSGKESRTDKTPCAGERQMPVPHRVNFFVSFIIC
ncbi:MAG TPA: hypothetical protein DCF42_06090 [Lachnospiraceae bacterium]|jgi:hypothetical protein|nr:hypothetical protein [Lachnospiraceae bacterium]